MLLGLYWVLPSLMGCYEVFTGFYWVLWDATKCLLGFNGFL